MEIERILVLITWSIVQITYFIALVSSDFRKMAREIMGMWVIVFGIFELATSAAIIGILLEWPDGSEWALLYTIPAMFWAPVIMLYKSWSVRNLVLQRVPLVLSLAGALITTYNIFSHVDLWLQIMLCMWCALRSFDVVVWDLVYTKWLVWG